MRLLSDEDAARVERAIAEAERRCGGQIVAAVVERADGYPEVPWRAFSLGCAIAALVALALDIGRSDWVSAAALLGQALAILGSGGAAALATLVLPRFARLFVREARIAEETRQRAETMFLARALSATPRRDAVLLFVSLFEHRIVVVPDVGYRERVSPDDWQRVVDRMRPELAAGHVADAFVGGVVALTTLLGSKGFRGEARGNALPNTLVQGNGT
jgi:putative membrane protein